MPTNTCCLVLTKPTRLMSDYEVNLVNDSMQEFYVMFNGPEESELSLDLPDERRLSDS